MRRGGGLAWGWGEEDPMKETLADDLAYRSMYYYLEDLYKLTGSDEIGGMLGYMAL